MLAFTRQRPDWVPGESEGLRGPAGAIWVVPVVIVQRIRRPFHLPARWAWSGAVG
jgi:hypothetical protein